MVYCSFHCDFSGFLDLAVGCLKIGLEFETIFFNWIHPVPGFNFVLEFPRPVNNCVGNFGRLCMGVRGSIQFPVF